MKKLLSLILVAVMLLTAVPLAFAEGNTYKVGDIIQFGSYPQSEVKDETLIAELNALAPEWDDWTSYGYYSGTGDYGTMVSGDWMRYVDIKHDGKRYRGVKFTQYRPYSTYDPSYTTYQAENGYSTNTVYWFKFEPVDWRVLDPATGLVMCETIIDSQPYSNTIYISDASGSRYAYNDSSYTNYASDYETSSIRKWLNNDFYNTAFTDSEKKEINTTTLNNDGYYTSVGTTGYEKLDSNSTNDKIFLLSYNEVRNSNYGFNSSASADDKARQAQGSDYAQSQGLYVYRSSGSTYNNSYWLLRSPGNYSSNCCCIFNDGYSSGDCVVSFLGIGVRPALNFNLSSGILNPEHTHSYSSVITIQPTHLVLGEMTYTCSCGDSYTEVISKTLEHTFQATKITAPTCEKAGYTTYICACGDSYKDNFVAEKGHSYSGQMCTTCGEKCSCNCHKSGFMGFIWKITLFFSKLFKTKKVCNCGIAHY